MSSIPPLAVGPDTPVVAVASLLAGAVAARILATGGGPAQAVLHTLLSFSLMTLLFGATLFLIGALRLGQALRFVPYPVVAGFLAATGCLLMMASYQMLTGDALTIAYLAGMPAKALGQLGIAAAFALGLLMTSSRVKSAYFLPAAFFGAAGAVDIGLWSFASDSRDWFIGIGTLKPWLPLTAAASGHVDWAVLLGVLPEMGACVIVGVISLLVKVSSMETSRSVTAGFDREFCANGAASLVAAPLGAMAGSVLVGPSKVFVDAGAQTRFAGIAASLVIALVVFAGVDIPGLLPKPILAGLLLFLGYTILSDALKGACNQKSWLEVALAVAIAVVCLRFGYVIGVVVGFVSASLIFAFSYGRIGVIRRQLTRASFSGNVERSPDLERALRRDGDAIQIYWLSGYIFFGSSEALFDRVRHAVEADRSKPVRYLVLDFAGVSGMDSSAIASLLKLKNFADKRSLTLAYCALSAQLDAAFRQARLLGTGSRHVAFPTRTDALNWAEEQLLKTIEPFGEAASIDFESWLRRELACDPSSDLITTYFERKEYNSGDVLYRQGDAADSIDFVAAGTLALFVDDGHGSLRQIRRSTRQTVLGEMGFFRGAPRAATIIAQDPAVIYTMSRERWESFRRDCPGPHAAFLIFVIRTLSDRLALAHGEITALT